MQLPRKVMKMKWNPKTVSKFGANVAVIGMIGSGKTTLQEKFAEYVYDGTFNIWVHAPKEVFEDNWKGSPIHKRRVTFRSKRFNYLKRGYNNSLVFLEDLPSWVKGEHGEKTDQLTLNNFLSTIRHRKTVFFASAQSISDMFDILLPQVLAKFTHYIFFNSSESLLKMQRIGIQTGSCYYLERIIRSLKPFEAIMLDLRYKFVTKPFINLDSKVIADVTLGNDCEKEELQVTEKIKVGNKIVSKVPLNERSAVIVERLKQNPQTDLRKLAKELGMSPRTMYNWLNRLKKRGYLDKNERYGAPRR